MTENWPVLIGTLVQVQQALAQVDGGLWPHHYPEVKAGKHQVDHAEQKLGFSLPSSYRDFLLHADGWKGFFQSIDLFGCGELVGGKHREYFEATYGRLNSAQWGALTLSPEAVLPIALTLEDKDALVLDLRSRHDDEFRIVWLAGEPIDEWPSFAECFTSMIEYNRHEVRRFSQG